MSINYEMLGDKIRLVRTNRGFSQPSITRHKKEALKAITDAYNDYILGAVFMNEC